MNWSSSQVPRCQKSRHCEESDRPIRINTDSEYSMCHSRMNGAESTLEQTSCRSRARLAFRFIMVALVLRRRSASMSALVGLCWGSWELLTDDGGSDGGRRAYSFVHSVGLLVNDLGGLSDRAGRYSHSQLSSGSCSGRGMVYESPRNSTTSNELVESRSF